MKPGRRTAARQLLLGFGFTGLAAAAEKPAATPEQPPPPAVPTKNISPTPFNPIEEGLLSLLRIRRLHVSELSGGEAANQIRDMIIASFQASGLFAVTENPERADAFLKGTAEDLVFNEQFSSGENLSVRSGVSTGRGALNGRNSERAAASIGINQSEDVKITERKHEAVAAVRIVNREGDVLWSTTQESYGAKFRGASADVAEKITRQLRADFDRARKLPSQIAKGND
jgi:hypothetical protein